MMRFKCKKIFVLFVFISVFFILGNVSASNVQSDYEVTSVKEIEDSINNSTEDKVNIKIKSDIMVAETINIPSGKDVSFTGGGTLVRDNSFNTDYDGLIVIEKGGKLTVDGVSVNGNNIEVHCNENGSLIDCEGKFLLKSGKFYNDNHYGYWSSTINVIGSESEFIMEGGSLENNIVANKKGGGGQAQDCGIVGVYKGGTFKLKSGSIKNNVLDINGTIATSVVYVTPEFYGYESNDSYFYMTGGEIIDNKANYGGVFIGVFSQPKYTNEAYFTMDDGLIANNEALRNYNSGGYGGGVMVNLSGNFTLNNGTIKGNKSRMGGGIAVNDGFVTHGAMDAGFDHNDWINKYHCPGAFTMNGGTIEDNEVKEYTIGDEGCGGGVYVASNKVVLNGGKIQNNKAERQGGGVYVGCVPYVLQMNDVVITENNADIGGGLWFCPTGTVEISVKNGGAVFDNNASTSGDDFMAENKNDDEQKKYYAYLSSRMLGGGKTVWYEDKEDARYADTDNPIEMSETNVNIPVKENIYLHADTSAGAKEIANKEKRLVIQNNESVKGGGVGSNGAIKIGQRDNDELELRVEKAFSVDFPENLKPESIKVYLTIDGIKTDYIELKKENGYKGKFTHLPNRKDALKKYYIVEESSNISKPVYSDAVLSGNVIKIKLTNYFNKTKNTGELKISKTVSGKNIDKDKEFIFRVWFKDTDSEYKYEGSRKGTVKNGGTIKLKHSQSVIIKGLPVGTSYKVEEEKSEGYRVKSSGEIGTISKEMSIASFENIKNSGIYELLTPDTSDDSSLFRNGGILILSALGLYISFMQLLPKRKR